MTSDKATPRPWFIKWECNVFGASERGICSTGGHTSNTTDERPVNLANAALIVTAVNQHAALLAENAALRACLEQILLHCDNSSDGETTWERAVDAARKLLEGKSDAA